MATTAKKLTEAQKAAKKAERKEAARTRFVKNGNTRTNNVLRALDILGKLAAPQYEYTTEDVDLIFGAITEKVREVEKRFEQPTTTKREPVTILK